MLTQFLTSLGACYAVSVVRGSPNPGHFRLAARLKASRKQAGLTRMALAEKASVSESTALYVETGEQMPAAGTVARLAVALGLSPAWLAYGLGEPSSEGAASSCEGMGERLLKVRTERGLSKAALARLAELSPGAILGIENGGQAGVDTVERIAKELHISPAWLAYGAGPQVLPSRRGARAAQSAADS